MELEIGRQCSMAGCHQLDFLPLTCKLCSKDFCKDHISFDGHQCRQYSNNAAVGGSHEMTTKSSQCSVESCTEKVLQSNDAVAAVIQEGDKPKVILGYLCNGCGKCFCVRHRHKQDHECHKPDVTMYAEQQRRREAAQTILKQHEMALQAAARDADKSTAGKKVDDVCIISRKSRSKKLNPKIELIKMKMKASGSKSIPESARWYIRIFFGNNENKPIFVDKTWSLGKVLDVVCQDAKVPNKNNTLSDSDPNRVNLFDFDSGSALDSKSGITFSSPINEVLESGQFVILDSLGNTKIDQLGICTADVTRYSF